MVSGYARYSGFGGGSGSGVTIYSTFSAFPASAPVGTLAIAADTGILYEYFAGSWQVLAQLGTAQGTPYQQVPVGLINSANTSYTISQAPGSNAAFVLFLDGLALDQGVDYTISGTTITMASAPKFGSSLYCIYTVSSGGGNVTSVNGNGGAVTIAGGTGISVGTTGPAITISSTVGNPLTISGSRGAPNAITAGGGIGFTSTTAFTKSYITGSGGSVIVSANPQIAAGTSDGQQLVLQGCSAVNTVEIQNGNGLVLNGTWFSGLYNSITLTWDTSNWVEMSRQ